MLKMKIASFFCGLCALLSVPYISEARKVGSCVRNVQGSRCFQPGAHWQHDGVCVIQSSESTGSCNVPDTRDFRFSLVAKVRQKDAKAIKKLWIRGSGPSLSWEKSKAMLKSAQYANTWSVDISYSSDSNALLCLNSSYCSLNQQAVEVRIYRDELGNDGMLGPNIYIRLPVSNSMTGVTGFLPPKVKVYPWFDSSSVKAQMISLTFKSYLKQAGETLRVRSTILYPPSFDYNIYKTYPLVIMFGTNEPAHITPLLEHMYTHEASIEEAVVVSVHYLDKAPFCAFNPFAENTKMTHSNTIWNCKAGDKDCHTCQTCWDKQRASKCTSPDFMNKAKKCLAQYACKGPASDILDFIETTLLPEIRKKALNRLQLDFPRQRMSILGFSGGGLLACFAAVSRPFYYSNAGCLSAPFDWPLGYSTPVTDRNTEGMGRFMRDLNTTLSIEPAQRALYMSQKYYIDAGELDNFYLPHIDAHNYTEWVVSLLRETLHLEPVENLMFFNVPKAGNSYYHHKHGGTEVLNRIKQPLLYFLGAKGGPNKKFARAPKIDEASFSERQKEVGMTEQDLSTLISSTGNISESIERHCLVDYRQRHSKDKHSSVSIPVYLVSVGMSVLVSVMLTAAFMYLREANKRAQAKEANDEDDDLMEELGSSIEDLDDLKD